ncbi:MAG: M48 family metalloprotease [Gammaproteobacteria bacterium]|nr:M48 family metalloprotease [Gammaproteobacteria bacterium]
MSASLRTITYKSFFGFVFVIMLVNSAMATQSFRQRASADQLLTPEDIESDVKAEIEFGRVVAARILGKYKLSEDYPLTKYVTLVGRALALNSNRPELIFHFGVLETKDINAYTAPGGYVFVTRGALNLMQDENELAGVLAHEIAHVTEMHIVEELDIKGTSSGVGGGLARIFGSAAETTRVAFEQVIDKAVSLLFREGLNKLDEFEADQVGTMLSANSGYDPSALYRYLQRVKQYKGEQTAIVSKTHPSFNDRLIELANLSKEESLSGLNTKIDVNRFNSIVKK